MQYIVFNRSSNYFWEFLVKCRALNITRGFWLSDSLGEFDLTKSFRNLTDSPACIGDEQNVERTRHYLIPVILYCNHLHQICSTTVQFAHTPAADPPAAGPRRGRVLAVRKVHAHRRLGRSLLLHAPTKEYFTKMICFL